MKPIHWVLVAIMAAGATIAFFVVAGAGGGVEPAGVEGRSTERRSAATREDVSPRRPAWFSPDSFWNTPLANEAPVLEESEALVATLSAEIQREGRERRGPWFNTRNYGVAVYEVRAGQPRVSLRLENPDADLRRAMRRVPIPDEARPALGADGHLVIWQPSSDTMWELYRARREGGRWVADYGGKIEEFSKSPGHYTDKRAADGRVLEKSGWGATATSLPLLGGLVTPEDLERGRIDHALALGIAEPSSGFLAPAKRTDGVSRAADAVPAGARFRLPVSVDIDRLGLTRFGRKVAEAAQRFGIVVRDTAGNVTFYGQSNATGDVYGEELEGAAPIDALEGFPWDELEVVDPTGSRTR